jgi:hypothetical protein
MTPTQALQQALAGEHAAVFLYGVLGARTSGSRQPRLFASLQSAFAQHRDERDALTELVSAKGVDPVAALVDYGVPGTLDTPAGVARTARTIEQRVTRTYGELVANTSGTDRRWAITALERSAVRGTSFGTPASNFPGLD